MSHITHKSGCICKYYIGTNFNPVQCITEEMLHPPIAHLPNCDCYLYHNPDKCFGKTGVVHKPGCLCNSFNTGNMYYSICITRDTPIKVMEKSKVYIK